MKTIYQIIVPLVFIISNIFYASSDSTFFKHALSADVYYQLISLSDSTYHIEWGGKNFVNTSVRIYEKGEVAGSGYYIFETANNDVIILSGGCGQSCQMYMVLPLFKGADEKIYMDVQALDISNNIIAYALPGSDIEIEIGNYITGQYMSIREQNVCGAASALDCIDECFIKGDSLFIKWKNDRWNVDRPDLQVKTYPIELSEMDEENAIPGIMGAIYGKRDIAEHFAQEAELDSADFEMRLWKLEGWYSNSRGFRITKRGGVWSAYKFKNKKIINLAVSDFYQRLGGRLKKVYIDPTEPDSGWENFYTNIKDKYKIFAPPPSSEVWCLDACTIGVLEIYRNGEWRVYKYLLDNKNENIIRELYSFCEEELD